jgi:hypothetical protein
MSFKVVFKVANFEKTHFLNLQAAMLSSTDTMVQSPPQHSVHQNTQRIKNAQFESDTQKVDVFPWSLQTWMFTKRTPYRYTNRVFIYYV